MISIPEAKTRNRRRGRIRALLCGLASLWLCHGASAQTATLTVSANPSSAGTVTGGGTYVVGTNVQITATASIGWLFVTWNDGDTNAVRTVAIPAGGTNFTALFNLNQQADSPMKFTTLAGLAGSAGSSNGTGTAARFNYPQSVGLGPTGLVYVADSINHLVRKITSSGVVTTLAGSAGNAGNTNATGTAARFNTPSGVAVDGAGNVFVADTHNHSIRKITPAGAVSTIAGAGVAGSADGTGTVARFNLPYGLAVDGLGNLLVADTGNHTIRQITPDGTVTTLAGTAGVSGTADGTGASARFYLPSSIAVDALGNIFVADTFNHTIRLLTSGGVVTTVAGTAGSSGSADGGAGVARFNQPYGVAADHAGHVYVADSGNDTVREVDAGGTVSTLGGLAGSPGSADGTGSAARFNGPGGLAADSAGRLFIADTLNHTIRQGNFVQTTDVQITAFNIIWPAGDLLGQAPTAITWTFQNNGPWDLASNTFNAGVSILNPDEWYLLGVTQFQMALRVGESTNISVPPAELASFAVPSNYWAGTWRVFTTASSPNNQVVGPHLGRPVYESNSVTFAGFFREGTPTLNGIVTTQLTVPPGTNVTGSFYCSLQNGQDPAAHMTAVIGFVNSSNQWVGGEPIALYSDVPPPTNTLQILSWTDLAPPSTPGIYTLRYKAYLTWQIPWCLNEFKNHPPTGNDLGQSFAMEGILGTVTVATPTDLQAIGINLTLPSGDPRGQNPTAVSVFLKNNGPGAWDWKNCIVEAYLAAQGAPQSAWLNLGGVNVYPQIAIGQTVTNTLSAGDLLNYTLPLYLPGGTYTVWLHAVPQRTAPMDTNTNNNWAAGNQVLVPRYTPRGMFNFVSWLGQLWALGSADGVGGSARFYSPYSVASDNFGNYYIADSLNHTIRKVNVAGAVSTFAGSAGSKGSADGFGSAARFNTPIGVATDGSGNVYVADTFNNTIRKITPAGLVSTFAGTAGTGGVADGTGAAARFAGPYAVAADGTGTVYVADTWNHSIRKITPAGVTTTLAGLGQNSGSADGSGSSARFYTPMGIAASPNGLIYVTDSGNHTIRKITQAGAVSTLAGVAGAAGSTDGTGAGARFYTPTGICVDNAGFLYVTDSRNHTIRGVNLYGVTFTVGGVAGAKGEANGIGSAARFDGPQSLTVDPSGNMVIADTYNNVIRVGLLITTATVHVAAVPATGGTVTGGGGYEIGSNATLTATANPGWLFSTWSDGTLTSTRNVTIPPYDSWYTARFLPTLGVAADAPTLAWTTGGASEWYGQLTTTHDNYAAMQSGAIGAGQTNWVEGTVATGPGSVLFWWKLSAAPTDVLQFYVNTQLVAQISGNAGWSQCATFLGSTNSHALRWVFIKNSAASVGSNAGFVDQVSFTSCAYATNVPQAFFQDTSGMLASWVLNTSGVFRFSRLLGITGSWGLKAAGDIDGDGVSDLLFQTPGGDTGGWFLNADGSTRDARFWWNIGNWEIRACADYEALGRGQVFFQNSAGTVAYWRLDTNGNLLAAVPIGNMGAWQLRTGGDLDGDGKAELFWQNSAGIVAIWYHNPDGTIRGTVPFATGSWALRAAMDIDGDNVTDLLWQTPDGRTAGWFMNPAGTPRDARYWWSTGTWKLKAAGR
jgi:hypothetical protein